MLGALIFWMVAAAGGDALAQPFPYRPLRLVGGYALGGHGDTIARIIGPKLSELWGQPVLIENRIGAAGTIAAAFVAKAPADGHTLLMVSNLALAAVMIADLPYDPVRDFTMVGRIATVSTVLAVGSWVPAKTAAELVAYAKARPGQLTGASSGNGSSSGFALEMFKAAAGIDILHVPYNGMAPAVWALRSGQVGMVFAE